jgi:pilus assembly protein Flp/PilA
MEKVHQFLNGFVKDENGASAAEYALILAIVTTGIAGATILLGTEINGAITDAANCISTPATC